MVYLESSHGVERMFIQDSPQENTGREQTAVHQRVERRSKKKFESLIHNTTKHIDHFDFDYYNAY